jgi:phthalate 4,5-dioxygenase oxygenase subunit
MLSREDNELLVRVGPGTAMGELFRRFWTPVKLASELRGEENVAVSVLGEQFTASRGGLHQRNPQRTFPLLERGGLMWAYLGPAERQPAFPNYEGFHVPADHQFIRKMISKGNYLQLMEGDVDSSHVSFLHSRVDAKPVPGVRADPNTFADRMPRWFPQETAYGLMLSAQRNAGPDHYQWRVNQFLMPYITLVAAPPGLPLLHQVRVPIDDETTMHFRCYIQPDRPLTADEIALFDAGVIVPEIEPRTFETRERFDNDYLVDRDAQRGGSYTGIRSIVAQDLAVTQNVGGSWIADRSREYLVSSDRAIIMLRKRLLTAAKALAQGIEPPEPHHASSFAVRSGDFTLARDVSLEEGARRHRLVHAG